jgi:hypothetical protein
MTFYALGVGVRLVGGRHMRLGRRRSDVFLGRVSALGGRYGGTSSGGTLSLGLGNFHISLPAGF